MTVFGLHTPHSLLDGSDAPVARDQLTDAVLGITEFRFWPNRFRTC